MQWAERSRTSEWNPVLGFLRRGFIIDKIICLLQMRTEDKAKIQEGSLQWNTTLYQLQMATGHPSIKLLNLHRYPILVDKSSNDPSIRAIVDTTDLKSDFKSMVVEKRIPIEDVLFVCGHINLHHYHQQLNKPFHFLICQVALGSIVPFSEDSEHADSLLIEPQAQDDNPFHYNVLLKSYHQYQVRYECSFTIGDENEVRSQPIICSFCGNRTASLYCKDEQKHFCQDCSSVKHPAIDQKRSKELSPPIHRLEAVNRTNSLPLCESHGYRHELYCLKCEKYLCPACYQQELHYQNEDHPVRPLQYLYSEKRQANARLPIKTREKLNNIHQIVKKKQDELTRDYGRVKKEIIVQFQRAMDELQKMYRERLILTQSDLITIEMELDRINWNLMFSKTQEETLKPVIYFKLQAKLEEDFQYIKSSGFNSSVDVHPDIEHFTIIRVGDKDSIAQLKKSTSPIKKTEDHQFYQKGKASKEEFRRMGEKMATFDPAGDPPQRGELSLLLQNCDIHFFKVQRRKD